MSNQGSITVKIKMDEYCELEIALSSRVSGIAKELDKHNDKAKLLQKELEVATNLAKNFKRLRQEYEKSFKKLEVIQNGSLDNENKTKFDLKKEEAEALDSQISQGVSGSYCASCE